MKNLKRILFGLAILSIGFVASANATTVSTPKGNSHITQTTPTTGTNKSGDNKGKGKGKGKGHKKGGKKGGATKPTGTSK